MAEIRGGNMILHEQKPIILIFGYREKKHSWSLNSSTNHHTNQNMSKSEQLYELWGRRHGLSQGIASKERGKYQNILEKKKKKSEGTGYQGHIDKKKLKIALKERKHINANKPVCGLRAWKKTHLLTKQR